MSSNENERAGRRTREACKPCRRKKTRCPGERPACAYCVRLRQRCTYASEPSTEASTSQAGAHAAPPSPPTSTIATQPPGGVATSSWDLTARVSQLEHQLRAQLNGARVNPMPEACDSYPVPPSQSSSKRKFSSASWTTPPQRLIATTARAEVDVGTSGDTQRFAIPPPPAVFKLLVDVYFLNCHNQPYCFFHESSLRRSLVADDIPPYLMLAIASAAVRYSMHELYRNQQQAAAGAFARASWTILLERFFASNQSPDIAMAQATAILAVTDFVAGQHRLGWTKVGLAIRLVQDLKLNAEPGSDLSSLHREEMRRVFWSMYTLDKFFACSRTRPVSISDTDCTVALPSDEDDFRGGNPDAVMPTLAVLRDPFDFTSRARLDGFAMFIMMCSLLARTVKNMLQNGKITVPCWDCRSDFAETSTILMSFEGVHSAGESSLATHIAERFGTYDGFDRQKAGHFVWARGIYHLCGMILYHPLTLYRHRQACNQNFPATFARETLDRCQYHLNQATDVLATVQSSGCCARGSFLGYIAATAASLHKIFQHSAHPNVADRATRSLETCMDFLEQPPICWSNYSTMAAAVRNLSIDATLAQHIINLSLPTTYEILPAQMDSLLRNVDYAWLSDPDALKAHEPFQTTEPDLSGLTWPLSGSFQDGSPGFDLGMSDFIFGSPGTNTTGAFFGLLAET